jgi:ABC-type branched-subunit amino acid transport system ATPase component
VVVLSASPTDPHKDVVNYDRVALKAGGEERLNSLLSKIEPRLKAVRSLNPYQAALLYADIGLKERIPAVHLGQGFVRLLSIYSEILASGQNDSVLLIDEFENGLHYSVLTEVWRGILNLAEQENVQVFATTHSYECIQAAHAAFAETLAYDFALHRLEEVKGEITVISYDRETLETSLKSNFEIR